MSFSAFIGGVIVVFAGLAALFLAVALLVIWVLMLGDVADDFLGKDWSRFFRKLTRRNRK